MNDLISNVLVKARTRRKPLAVIKRYLFAKYKILVSDDVLQERISQATRLAWPKEPPSTRRFFCGLTGTKPGFERQFSTIRR